MLVRENKVCTHAVEIWYVLLVAMVVVFFSGSVINFWPIRSRDFFLFETNQCSRLKTHPGILMLLSFISNFDFVVLTSIFLVDVMQLDLTIIIFYFSNQIQRVFQQFDCFGSLLILDCWTVNSSRSLTTGIYLKKHNYH